MMLTRPMGAPVQLPSIDALTDRATLDALFGRIDAVDVMPLGAVVLSNAILQRVRLQAAGSTHRSLVLKHTRLHEDWTALRTADACGRESLLLSSQSLAPVWEIFACPYVAFASAPGEVGLLMHDLSGTLLPDLRAPLLPSEEAAILNALARMHARFWNAPQLAESWLVRPSQYSDALAPCAIADESVRAVLSPPLRDAVPRGWAAALARLPGVAASRVSEPGLAWERKWAGLPRTLLHGDVRVANFAVLQDGRVAAFDWAMAGAGPCTIDLGWYLAVNASRLTGPKEQILARYRVLLERALGESIDESTWTRLEEVAVVCGARMLLWSKALAADSGRAGAVDEWNWWVERLQESELCHDIC